jgi:putative ABC transport system permease protein
MISFLELILRNGLRSRRRSILTVCSGAASFCILGILMATYSLFFLTPPNRAQALRLIVRNRTSIATPIPFSYMQRIREVPGVREVMIQQWFGGTYKDPRDPRNNFARFAVEPRKLFLLHPEFVIDSSQKRDFLQRQDACILAKSLAERLKLRIGDHVALAGDIFHTKLDLLVAGFYESSADNEALYFHNEFLNSSLCEKPDFAIMFMVLADRLDLIEPLARDIDEQFRNAVTQTRTEPEKALQVSFLRYVGDLKLFFMAAFTSLAVTLLLVSATTVGMSVRERVPEVGVLKALGFPPEMIVWLIVSESVVIALISAVIGFGCAEALLGAIRRLPLMMVNLTTLDISPRLAAIGLLLAILVATSASFPFAWHASRRRITDCLGFAD